MAPSVRPLTDLFGAEVQGVDLAHPLDDATRERILDAFHRHGVLLFRDQRPTPVPHSAFSRIFGELEFHVLRQCTLPDQPEVVVLTNIIEDGKPKGISNRGGQDWHSDLSYKREPSLGSLLYAVEVPAEGGDTKFASMHAAYDALPAERKARLEGLKAVHSYPYFYERMRRVDRLRPPLTEERIAAVPPVEQPVVRVHPVTGRKAIYVSPALTAHIVGLPAEESRALLEEIFAHATQPRFVYRHRRRVGDLVVWDNRSTMHRPTGYDDSRYRRVMHRTTVKGEAVIA